MTRVNLFGLSLLTLLAAAAGLSSNAVAQTPSDEMIVGGTEAVEGQFPYQVRLYGMDDNKGFGFCGGSIIGKQWILTAAHCVRDTPELMVGYGSTDRTKTNKIASEKVIVHPDYRGEDNDVALIKLQSQIDDDIEIGVADAATEADLVKPGAKLVVSGWGALWEVKKDKAVMQLLNSLPSGRQMQQEMYFPQKLHWVDIEEIPLQDCRAVYKAQTQHREIAETEICAMQPGKKKDSCYGDSGGPLVVPAGDDGKPVQVGVVSWGEWCAHDTLPGVYARVSSFKPWIDDTIKNN